MLFCLLNKHLTHLLTRYLSGKATPAAFPEVCPTLLAFIFSFIFQQVVSLGGSNNAGAFATVAAYIAATLFIDYS